MQSRSNLTRNDYWGRRSLSFWRGTGNWIWDAGTNWQSLDKIWFTISGDWDLVHSVVVFQFGKRSIPETKNKCGGGDWWDQSKFNYFALVWYIFSNWFWSLHRWTKEDSWEWTASDLKICKCSALSHLWRCLWGIKEFVADSVSASSDVDDDDDEPILKRGIW